MKTCCDHECAEANNCQVGGIECEECHGHFCSNEITRWHGKVVCENCEIELEEEFRSEWLTRERIEILGIKRVNEVKG